MCSRKKSYAAAAASIELRDTSEMDERGRPGLKNGVVTLGGISISAETLALPAILSKPCMRCCKATPPTIT